MTGPDNIASGTSPSGAAWELRLGSCLDPLSGLYSLPDRSVDHVIADPQYEEEAHTKQRRQKGKTRTGAYKRVAKVKPLVFPPMTEAERYQVATQWGRIVRGWVVVFCQVEAVGDWRRALTAGGLTYRRTIPWCKPDAMPSMHGRWPGQAFESIVLASAPRAPKCPGGGKAVFYTHTRVRDPVHPTQKSDKLMDDLVELVSRPGDLIVDSYAGSGSTGVAALKARRRFLGWELLPQFFEVARRRLAAEELRPAPGQVPMFEAAA